MIVPEQLEASHRAIVEAVCAEVRRVAPSGFGNTITLDDSLYDIGLDSLTRMEVLNALEAAFKFRFSEDALLAIETCRDLVEYIARRTGEGNSAAGSVPVMCRSASCEASGVGEVQPEQADAAQFPECAGLAQRLAAAKAAGLENPFFRVKQGVGRDRVTIGGREVVSYTSFDYLGLARDPRVIAAAVQAIQQYGTSASASRLVGGNHTILEELDHELARFLGTPSAVTFPSGFGTNASVLGHLFGPEDLILHDELAHRSIVEGARLSRAHCRPFPHNDAEFLDALLRDVRNEYRRVVIAIEGVYSMDGDYPDLPQFVEVKRRHAALLYVDEAHSVGVMGRTGRGICEHFGVDPAKGDLWMGTISKALGGLGGYLAGQESVIRYLKYTTPAVVFATAVAPANAAAALAALRILEAEPQRVARLRQRAALFLQLARQRKLNTGHCRGTPVIPVILGDSARCVRLSSALLQAGIDVQPILYPAVPEGVSRLRFFLTAEHSEAQIRHTIDVLAEHIAAPTACGGVVNCRGE